MFDGQCGNRICTDEIRTFGRVYAIGYRYQRNLLYKLINHLKFNMRYYEANAIPLAALLWGYLRDHISYFEEYEVITYIPHTEEKASAEGDPLGLIYQIASGFFRQTGMMDLHSKMVPYGENKLRRIRDAESSFATDLAGDLFSLWILACKLAFCFLFISL